MEEEYAAFQMNADTAYEFFDRCIKRGANTFDERLAILKELQKELRAIKLNDKDLKRTIRGKRILIVKPEEGNDNA